MADEATGKLGYEDDRGAGRRNLARAQACDGTPRGNFADQTNVLEFGSVTRRAVVVITLHLVPFGSENHATDTVAGLRIAADESVRVAIGARTTITGDRSTFRIVDSGVVLQRRGFAINGHRYRIGGLDRPRVIEIEVSDVTAHQHGIGEACVLILCRA